VRLHRGAAEMPPRCCRAWHVFSSFGGAHGLVLRLPGPVGREDRVIVCRSLQVRLPMRHLSLPSMVELRQAVTGQAITTTPCYAREEESSIMPVATQPIE